ncbi:hypothetical protein OEZ85_006289 [Tetradesmus obliquus]|uniref:ABC transporter family G domain-containing protein n=1 Tax=Tetradesmus obliquus TaxID=3088 RepID=A0ABY8TWI8_TETOB|nr:hypothetical protein OEZ85_006289 [Tetradesmus obliquus]
MRPIHAPDLESTEVVTLLAGGRLMYHGPQTDISAWFESLGYPRLHGSEAEWLLDLVASGFELLLPSSYAAASQADPGTYAYVLPAPGSLASITPGQQAVLQQLTQPQEGPQTGCVIRNDALLEYMQYGRPFGVSVAILGGYLGVVHLLTYAALVLLARHEAR